ncbi:protein kinase [Lentinula aciculospora]|uniref:Protein kinase n=1 Tax=Lentinula aciculospora TaxID=153920 RepID=A0A9W8ZTY4_9AGAR|nr:protein kinase [Lentinula aciculospora]
MAMVCQLNKLSTEKLGYIPNLHLNDFDYLRDPKQLPSKLEDNPESLIGAAYSFRASDGKIRTVIIKKVLYRAEGIVGWHLIVVEVECICTESGCTWHGERRIMKISFPSRSRTSEEELIREARAKAETSGEHWALNHLPELIDTITITYDKTTTVQGHLKAHLKEKYEERVMRITGMEKLHPLLELNDLRDFAQVFYDIVQIHQWLYECAGILHRDLSSGNIMFRCKDGKIYGVLNDFNLSLHVQDMDLLNLNWEGGHFYRHNLESLFYIILCLACRYAQPGVPAAEPRAYSKWFNGTDKDVFTQKNAFLTDPFGKGLAVQPYFTEFRSWLSIIHCLMSDGYKAQPSPPMESEMAGRNAAILLTLKSISKSSERENFNWYTLNGWITYLNFRTIMSSFQDEPLETHWSGGNLGH